jgi:hypothetical protein
MLSKTNHWIFNLSAVLFIAALAILGRPIDVSAAQPTSVTSNSCFTCHEDLYYLYDTGKYYCITEHQDRCVNCHEGNASVMNKEESHLGLVLHPQKDDGAKCQQCHIEDTQERLATFKFMGGYKPVIVAVSQQGSDSTLLGFQADGLADDIGEKLPVLVGGLVLFGLWLVLVLSSPQKP